MLLLVVSGACKKKADDPESKVRAALSAAIPGVSFERRDDTLSVRRGEVTVDLSLGNLVRSCASSADQCERTIGSIVLLARDAFADGDAGPRSVDPTLIRLTPKPREWLKSADEMTDQSRLVRTRFTEDLSWLYVIDRPDSMEMVTETQLASLGLTIEGLHALAVANLAKQFPALELTDLRNGVWMVSPGQYLDSARMALNEQWRAEATSRGGRLWAVVASRSVVFVIDDEKQRPALSALAQRAFAQEDHPLSTAVLEWSDGGWRASR